VTSLTKNPHSPTKKFIFECRLQDLPRLLRLWPGQQHLLDRRNSRAKPCAFWCFFLGNLQNRPDTKVLITDNCIFSLIMQKSLVDWTCNYPDSFLSPLPAPFAKNINWTHSIIALCLKHRSMILSKNPVQHVIGLFWAAQSDTTSAHLQAIMWLAAALLWQ